MTEFTDKDIFSSKTLKQPKREIADYVEQNGFLVPLRYASLREAIASRRPFIVRSEHPQDYDGASGVLDSLFVSYDAIARCSTVYLSDPLKWEDYFKRGDLHDKPHMTGRILVGIRGMTQGELEEDLTNLSRKERMRYCSYAGLSEEEFASQISYSYWELLPGLNRTVMADSAIEDRYHIFTVSHSAPSGFPLDSNTNYFIVEGGRVVQGNPLNLPEDLDQSISSLVETYDGVRNLRQFPSKHCPIVELQSARNRHYFLQYHKGIDFMASEFQLQRRPKSDEIEAIVVRGATPPEGLPFTVRIDYGTKLPDNPYEAVLDYMLNPMYLEAVLRKRTLQVIFTPNRDAFFTEDRGHMPRSRLLKPQISAVFEYPILKEFHRDIKYTRENPVPPMGVHIISDGRKAYMSRI